MRNTHPIFFYCLLPAVFILLSLGLYGCDGKEITLRPFPYPYHAGLAFCSDIDNTDSIEEFLTIQEYLCTRRTTRWGEGLGMETGNSFWFYDPTGTSDFTIFDTNGAVNDSASQVIEDFIRAGYIDFLHTYGDFTSQEFRSEMAEKALAWFLQRDLTVPLWVNHGDTTNNQCPGRFAYQRGDDLNSQEYHTDLLHDFGIRYIEIWRVTHRIAMDADAGWHDRGMQLYEFAYSIKEMISPGMVDIVTNRYLLNQYTLDDGQEFWRFRRFVNDDGKLSEPGVDAGYLAHQLRPENLDRLAGSDGYMVVYTHFGANETYKEWLPEETRTVLKDLADRFHRGDILVTTTSRLLNYNKMKRFIKWSWEKTGDGYLIFISGIDDPVFPDDPVTIENLAGLTFYTPSPERTTILFQGAPIDSLQVNAPDQTGQLSVTIPWKWLKYPDGY